MAKSRPFVLSSVVLLGLCSALPAFAQKKAPRVVRVDVTIVGRVQRPGASVDVARIQPKPTLSELRQPLLDRIEQPVSHDPF